MSAPGIVLCSTGLSPADRRALEEAAKPLSPHISFEKDLTDQTTHLVATCVSPRSAKLACALRLGLPVVLPQWVHDCAHAGRVVALRELHMLPPLAGVKLQCGGAAISASDHDAIRAAVEGAGGLCAAPGEACTHLMLATRTCDKAGGGDCYAQPPCAEKQLVFLTVPRSAGSANSTISALCASADKAVVFGGIASGSRAGRGESAVALFHPDGCAGNGSCAARSLRPVGEASSSTRWL